jgi:hypothetical protein
MEREGIRIVHVLPGRVRLKAPSVKGNPALALQVQKKLRGISGVREVRANPLTGSVLLLVDLVKLVESEALAPALEELFPEITALELASRIITGAGQATTGLLSPTESISGSISALNTRISHLTGGIDLKLLLPLTLLYLGLRQLLTAKKAPAPAWYDFLWFGFSTFIMLNRGLVEGKGGTQGHQTARKPAPG